MADPISLAAMAAGGISSAVGSIGSAVGALTTGAVGTGLSAIGAGTTAASTAAMYSYQSGLAAQNAKIQQQNATYAQMSGEQQASNAGLKARNIEGQILASQGASGLNVNSGTMTKVQEGQRLTDQTNMTTIRSNAAKQAYDYEVSAANSTAQSQAYGSAATMAGITGALNVGSSLLGGGSKVASQWSQGQQSGLFKDQTIKSVLGF